LAEISVEDDVPVPTRRARPNPEFKLLLLLVAMLIATIGVVSTLALSAEPIRPAGAWLYVTIVVMFAFAEWSVFHFEFRKEAISFSLSEVPLALALVFFAPGLGIVARLIGGVAVLLIFRRPPLQKMLFNLLLFVVEVALAYAIFDWIVSSWGDADSSLVLAAVVAVFFPSIVASVLVSLAISFYEGSLASQIVSDLRVAGWLFIVNSTVAGVTLGLGLVTPLFVFFAVVPISLLWFVLKRYGSLDQRLRDLDALHGFAARIGRTLDPEEIGKAALAEITRLLRADHGALVLFDDRQAFTTDLFLTAGVALPEVSDDPAWSSLLHGASPVSLVAMPEARKLGIGSDLLASDLLVSSISDRSGPIGVVIVAGRSGVSRRFSEDDIARLGNLSEQLATSVGKGMLHQRIEREARRDALTELPNRSAFERSVAAVADESHEEGIPFVMMLDLDRFKEVNDTLGHQAGDDLLIEVARRLSDRLLPGDVLARLAGDEFAVMARRPTREQMTAFAEACVRDVGRPVTLDGLEIVVTVSAGLSTLEGESDEPGVSLRRADIAMYNAKSHRLGVEVYSDEIDRRTPARLSMLGDLRSAIEGALLDVHYQPKLDLASGMITGAEALVRWTHPVRGMVPPAQFVRVAEDTGLIKQLTDLMLGRGIATLRDVHDRGYHLGMSVNLSTHDLLDTRLAERVDEHLRHNDVDASLLTLEITESSLLIDAPRARSTIGELNEVGVHMSIDDFGTGYSSLSYLRRLPVGELKIDRSFVANVLLDEQDEVIVRSTIDLGHNLGLQVVAEGVENNEVLERLREFGCDVAQGFCISRPLGARHLMSWLATTGHPTRRHDPLDLNAWQADVDANDELPPARSADDPVND